MNRLSEWCVYTWPCSIRQHEN